MSFFAICLVFCFCFCFLVLSRLRAISHSCATDCFFSVFIPSFLWLLTPLSSLFLFGYRLGIALIRFGIRRIISNLLIRGRSTPSRNKIQSHSVLRTFFCYCFGCIAFSVWKLEIIGLRGSVPARTSASAFASASCTCELYRRQVLVRRLVLL